MPTYKPKPIVICCMTCKGKGLMELTGECANTFHAIKKHGKETTATKLAKIVGIASNAMSMRLDRLESMGLVHSRRFGKTRIFQAYQSK